MGLSRPLPLGAPGVAARIPMWEGRIRRRATGQAALAGMALFAFRRAGRADPRIKRRNHGSR